MLQVAAEDEPKFDEDLEAVGSVLVLAGCFPTTRQAAHHSTMPSPHGWLREGSADVGHIGFLLLGKAAYLGVTVVRDIPAAGMHDLSEPAFSMQPRPGRSILQTVCRLRAAADLHFVHLRLEGAWLGASCPFQPRMIRTPPQRSLRSAHASSLVQKNETTQRDRQYYQLHM